MAKKSQSRESKHTRTVGEKPNQGRRYVENGRVRIEWTEDGKRRRRSFGENTAKARNEADAALEEILRQMRTPPDGPEKPADEPAQTAEPEGVAVTALVRSLTLSLMDTADQIAEWIRPEK